jgi:transcriptional regulator with XRE-family HTH domain
MERFPEKLRTARKSAKLNQTQLAQKVGVTQRSLTDYERGKAVPRKNTLRKLAESLNVTVEYLIRDDADDPQTGRLREDRINAARERFGGKGEQEMNELMDRNAAFLAGGDVDQAAKDAFFDALMTAYVTCKNEARAKFAPKSKRPDED